MSSLFPPMVISGFAKGLFIAFWVIGTVMIAIPLLQKMAGLIQRRRRFHNLGVPEKNVVISIRKLPIVERFAKEMDIAEMKVSVEFILALMLALMLVGCFGSSSTIYILQQAYATGLDRVASTHPFLISFCTGILFASLPYFYIMFRLQRKRHRIALRMIALVQNLIGHYRPSILIAELASKAGPSMHADVRTEWKRLELSLRIKPIKEALYEFAERIDNHWADDLVDILYIGLTRGVNITGDLQKLVKDMLTSKKNEEKRLAMITVYRIGTVFLVLAAFGIVIFNVVADPPNFKHYFLEPFGQFMMILTLIVLLSSMIMVLRSGRKQF
jgi:Flp pilus assembly protein TadB